MKMLELLKVRATKSLRSSLYSTACGMKDILRKKIPEHKERVKKFRMEHGKTKVAEVTVNMLYSGMRGLPALIWETSQLHSKGDGIHFRGLSMWECVEKLPKIKDEPTPEGVFWLMLTEEVPTRKQIDALSVDWAQRAALPDYIEDMINHFPKELSPIVQFSVAVTAMEEMSKFSHNFRKVPKTELWEHTYEDCMDLISKVTVIGALIYRNVHGNRERHLNIDTTKDWSYNFTQMMGFDNPEFTELMRLYFFIYSDHEGGNVSAHTSHLVASSFGTAYMTLASSLNCMGSPLHGLSSREVLIFLLNLIEKIGINPSNEQLEDYIMKHLQTGQEIPGYRHTVQRNADPLYIVQRDFALEHMKDDEMFLLVSKLYRVVPTILTRVKRSYNPWPNADAHSGMLLRHYGLTDMDFYAVTFGISRSLGVLSSLIWSHALLIQFERPRSVSTQQLHDYIKNIYQKSDVAARHKKIKALKEQRDKTDGDKKI